MKNMLISVAVVALSAGAALATDGATTNYGIGNGTTTTYTGPSVDGSNGVGISSVSSTQAGFLNAAWMINAGEEASIKSEEIKVSAPLNKVGGGGDVNMSQMFNVLNQSVTIGDR